MPANRKHVQICGGIASGKTTLATVLSNSGVHATYEKFSANPFYKAFYRNPLDNAFETEITFLLQHFHAIKDALEEGKSFCSDFSFVLDLAYADLTLTDRHRKVFMAVYREVRRIVAPPDLLVHLKCDPVEELRRIHRRRRAPEKSITTEYLTALNTALAMRVKRQSTNTKVVEIDSGQIDFAHDISRQKKVLALIQRRLSTSDR